MSKKLLKSGMIVSAMTLISRVLGLVRDIVIANLMGAGAAADLFFFANKIPNFLRRLFAEGAFAQAFVPVLTEYDQTKSRDEVKQLIAAVSGTLGTIVTVITILGVLGSGVITAMFGFGWFLEWFNGGAEAYKFELASDMLKITFPYLWFITFTALSGAILNTLGKFAIAAFTPVFLNIAIISCALFLSPQLAQPEFGLAIGVLLGGAIQFLFQIPFMAKEGMLVKPKWDWHHEGVVKIRTLMIPALFGVSVSQINLLLDTFIASFLQTGSISWLYYSDRLLEFPLGLFGIAIATVILPSLSSSHVTKSEDHFAKTIDWGIRMVCMLGFPAMLGLIVLAEPMLRVLFMRGEFDMQDVSMASMSLFAYGSGLLSFMMVKVLAPGYYARQDIKTPVKFGIIAMVSNMVLNIIFAVPFGYVGLAIATSISATLNAGMLWFGLYKQGVYQKQNETLGVLIRIVISGLLMAATMFYLSPSLDEWAAFSLFESAYKLFALIAIGITSYFACAAIIGLRVRHFKIS
ncbi:murein biosynthesis integral membrane protein MurJ [Psychromonas sp. Urea-02u-13]|uniref:murein biosynthesis integral membrane protein MurJ n=1 Tax=Psychromonas sp. Urea-02u-13 TaxID=2058326 RepID=UPI000C330316|nr:murein biosynthesis integral membrane protein MurJ [Psychromonas sp. Urea-02u-13]PKG40804.1 murein biosynthesis integral membrane protein MurJ [Psychromonas sp. Urea-02u-13]